MKKSLKTLSDLTKINHKTEWLWRDLIIRSHVTLLASRGGVGKSSFALWIAHEIALQNKKTLYVDYERTGGTHAERAVNWGLCKTENILFTCEDNEEGLSEPAPLKNNQELIKAIEDNNIDLLIIDSMSFSASGLKVKEREEAIRYLDTLKTIASRTHCGLLLLCHTNKKQDPEEQLTLDSIYGSGGITDAARSVMVLDCKDSHDPERVLRHVKSNYARTSEDISFSITEHGIENFETKKQNVSKTGTRAIEFRSLAEELFLSGYNKKQIQEALKIQTDASPTERHRAISYITKQHNIKWS